MSYRILKTNVLASVLALSVLSVACSPTAPDPPFPTPTPTLLPAVNYTVSGAVTEMIDGVPEPVEGVLVREANTGQSTMTDSKGLYSIPGVKSTHTSVSATKDGYVIVTTPFTATTDIRIDMRVARWVTYTLSGMAYVLTSGGREPIEGVSIYCEVCTPPYGHTFATTDANGLYTFSLAPLGTAYVQVPGKEGYQYVGPAYSGLGLPITITGHTRFDVEFVRR